MRKTKAKQFEELVDEIRSLFASHDLTNFEVAYAASEAIWRMGYDAGVDDAIARRLTKGRRKGDDD